MAIAVEKVFGSLLGLVLADALGARFEGLQRDLLNPKLEA